LGRFVARTIQYERAFATRQIEMRTFCKITQKGIAKWVTGHHDCRDEHKQKRRRNGLAHETGDSQARLEGISARIGRQGRRHGRNREQVARRLKRTQNLPGHRTRPRLQPDSRSAFRREHAAPGTQHKSQGLVARRHRPGSFRRSRGFSTPFSAATTTLCLGSSNSRNKANKENSEEVTPTLRRLPNATITLLSSLWSPACERRIFRDKTIQRMPWTRWMGYILPHPHDCKTRKEKK